MMLGTMRKIHGSTLFVLGARCGFFPDLVVSSSGTITHTDAYLVSMVDYESIV